MATALLAVLLSISVTSCSRDERDDIITPTNKNEAIIRLSINTPQPATPSAKTRASVDLENSISDIKVLVFGYSGDGFVFKYMVDGNNVATDGSQNTTFTALVKTVSETTKLMLIANADSAFDSYTPVVGEAESSVKSKIVLNFDSRLYADLPMWGETTLPTGITADGNNIPSVTMLRAVARIDVIANLNPDSYKFNLTSVAVYRTNSLINIAPNATIDGKFQVDAPSVSALSTLNSFAKVINSTDLYVEHPETGGVIETIGKLYVPESKTNTTDMIQGVTSIVVGGYFNNEPQPSFYRIDFDSKLAGHPYGQILRNYKYIFNIKRVWGKGWATPEDAANNKSTNIAVTVEKWNDFVTDMDFDTEHRFGVSARKVTMASDANSTYVLQIDTDLPTYTAQWADQNGVVTGTAITLGQKFSKSGYSAEITPTGSQIVLRALVSNAGGATDKTTYLLLKANRFEILITISQERFSPAASPVRVLSVRSYLGYLGSTDPSVNIAAEPRSQGLRGILTNTANFGPAGVVKTAGFFFSDVLEAYANTYITDLYLSQFDVVFLPDIAAQTVISPATAATILKWLKASDKRYLVVSLDEINRNKNTADALGVTGVTWANLPGHYPMATKSAATTYFTDSGPFNKNLGLTIPQSFIYRNNDAAHGEIPIASNPSITPILTGPSGGIVLGIDSQARVLYVGDIDMYYNIPGNGGTTDNRLTNITGDINNNAAMLTANTWAWIVQTVLAK